MGKYAAMWSGLPISPWIWQSGWFQNVARKCWFTMAHLPFLEVPSKNYELWLHYWWTAQAATPVLTWTHGELSQLLPPKIIVWYDIAYSSITDGSTGFPLCHYPLGLCVGVCVCVTWTNSSADGKNYCIPKIKKEMKVSHDPLTWASHKKKFDLTTEATDSALSLIALSVYHHAWCSVSFLLTSEV